MTTTNSSSSGGIGLAGLLGVLFIALKLTHVITWPWVWVLAPFWIPLGFGLVILAVILVVAGAGTLASGTKRRRR